MTANGTVVDGTELRVVVLKNTQAFTALKEDWEDLYYNSPFSTPFQSWSWLYSWWESFGEDYELRLITVWNGDLLVGLIPLMLEHWWGLHRLRFIGSHYSPMDLLARKGWVHKVCEAGIRALRQLCSWNVIDLTDVSPTAAAWGIFRQWNGWRAHTLTHYYLFIEVKSWDDLLTSLSRKYRSAVRRTLRRAEEDGIRSMLAESEEAKYAGRRLLALHRGLRQGRYIIWEHLTPEFESFIVAATRRITARGLGGIYEFWRDGEVIMSSFVLLNDRITYAYLVGVSQKARQRYQWSSLGIYELLNIALSKNSAWVCLAQKGEQYKQRWAHKEVPHYRMVLGREPVLWSLYSICLSLRVRISRYTLAKRIYTLAKRIANWRHRSLSAKI